MTFREGGRDPFDQARADIETLERTEEAVGGPKPFDNNPYLNGMDVRDLRQSVRALSIVLIRYERAIAESARIARQQLEQTREVVTGLKAREERDVELADLIRQQIMATQDLTEEMRLARGVGAV